MPSATAETETVRLRAVAREAARRGASGAAARDALADRLEAALAFCGRRV